MSIVTDNIKTDSYLSKDGTREYGRCTAWVIFNGTGVPTIRDSLNVASITDVGVGQYTINFSQPMVNTNYVTSFGSGSAVVINDISVRAFYELSSPARTTSSFSVQYNAANSGAQGKEDVVQGNITFFGGDA